jgi:hypothetical protein
MNRSRTRANRRSIAILGVRVLLFGLIPVMVFTACRDASLGETTKTVDLAPLHSIAEELIVDDSAPLLRIDEGVLPDSTPLGLQSEIVAELIQHNDTVKAVVIGDWDRLIVGDVANGRVGFMRTIARRGLGPNEFLGIRAICVTRGDTTVVVDAGARVTVLTPSYEFVRQFSAATKGDILKQGACTMGGHLLLSRPTSPTVVAAESWSVDGQMRGPRIDIVMKKLEGGEVFAVPFVIAMGDQIVSGDPYNPRMDVLDTLGRQTVTYRISVGPPDPPADPSAVFQVPMRGQPKGKPLAAPTPSRWPYFERVMFSTNGNLWFRLTPDSFDADETWAGFTSDGRVIGRLTLETSETTTALRAMRFTQCCVLVDRGDSVGRRSVELLLIVKRS